MSTYASLTQDIQDYAENDDSEFTDEMDNFILFAEERIFSDAPLHPAFKADNTGSFVQGTATISVPDGLRTIRAFSFTASNREVFLEQRTDTYIQDYWPDSSVEGWPKFYTRENDTSIKVAPTPSTTFAYTIKAYEQPTGLSSSNMTTWLSNNKSDLLLNACMIEAMKFTKNQEGRTMWQEEYAGSLKPFLAEMARTIGNENSTGV